MRIKQARVSYSLTAFRSAYLSKFNLVESLDFTQPVVLIGMYSDLDYKFLQNFRRKVIVVWCGTDSLMITPERVSILRMTPAIHIAKSKFISDDLNKLGIPNRILPISWQEFDITPLPLGENIFHYGEGDFYGSQYLNDIEKITGLYVIRTKKETFTKEELMKVYKSCFIGLRLTKHDGLPNTVLEMGMMGRRSIYNGGIPTSIQWSNLKGIIHCIMDEYAARETANINEVSDEIKRFINIGDSWLQI